MIAFLLIVTALHAATFGYWYRGWEQRALDRADLNDAPGLDDCHPDHHQVGVHAPSQGGAR